MKIHLDLIESRLRQMIETWIVPVNQKDFQHRLAHQVVKAMRENIFTTADGRAAAPNLFTIRLNPALVHELQGSSLLESLPAVLAQAAREAGLTFLEPPELRLEDDETYSIDTITVNVQNGARVSPGSTAVLRLGAQAAPRAEGGSFLILGENQIYPLVLPVINLGRRPDNNIVIDDPRISRVHAQIRYNRGQFILFDLNSTGGTVVNGQRIRQHSLRPGDVISLAGVHLIYGEEPARGEGASDTTQVIQPPPLPPEELL